MFSDAAGLEFQRPTSLYSTTVVSDKMRLSKISMMLDLKRMKLEGRIMCRNVRFRHWKA